MAQMRLDKFFSAQSIASRKEVKLLLKQGAITVNGQTTLKPEMKIDPDVDEITLQGKPVGYKKHLYLMLNKPMGYVSATEDRDHKTVLDLVPDHLFRPGLFPAGRLDKDTTGLMILTDDGDFAHQILAPKRHIKKVYHAWVNVSITEKQMQQFADGVVLKDGYHCLPAQMRVLEEAENTLVEITLYEGKYHQIKRMIAAVGGRVIALKRVQMGHLTLSDNLPEGTVKEILNKDLRAFL